VGGLRLKEERFQALEIPLPPLAEQRKLVARIQDLDLQVQEARALRKAAALEAEALHLSVLHRHFVDGASSWLSMPMDEAIEINDKLVSRPLRSRLEGWATCKGDPQERED
jgi:Type I restriction modification DNA specificity domain